MFKYLKKIYLHYMKKKVIGWETNFRVEVCGGNYHIAMLFLTLERYKSAKGVDAG